MLSEGMFTVNQLASTWLFGVCLLLSAAVSAQIVEPTGVQQPGTTSPHPAVVRIYVSEGNSQAIGSGTLIDVRDKFGLVVTNWHVIRDAKGEISVVFPDGFRSAARVVNFDQDWDLAALSIWRPQAQPVPLALQAPQPGDMLTIAGYGSEGVYRVAAGKCTQYLAPSEKHPYELVELAAAARKGDSGGPIFNARGELAGVLFGSVEGTTAGSYGGRVWKFLEPLLKSPQLHAAPAPASLATTAAPNPAPPLLEATSASLANNVAVNNAPTAPTSSADKTTTVATLKVNTVPLEPVELPNSPPPAITATSNATPSVTYPESNGIRTPPPFPYRTPSEVSFAGEAGASSYQPQGDATAQLVQMFLGKSPLEQGKAFFSLIGMGTVAVWFLRWNQTTGRSSKR
jgi:hypothetical protein